MHETAVVMMYCGHTFDTFEMVCQVFPSMNAGIEYLIGCECSRKSMYTYSGKHRVDITLHNYVNNGNDDACYSLIEVRNNI